jgi:hypothetical protein
MVPEIKAESSDLTDADTAATINDLKDGQEPPRALLDRYVIGHEDDRFYLKRVVLFTRVTTGRNRSLRHFRVRPWLLPTSSSTDVFI